MPDRNAIRDIAETIRALPQQRDDVGAAEFDSLPSDERVRIQRRRRELLALVGRLSLNAILDHRWQVHPLALDLEDRAVWARRSEQTKPYEQGAIRFLGVFVKWYREHTDLLPPGAPPLPRLDSERSTFRPEAVPREDFAKICEAIVWLMAKSRGPGGGRALTDPIALAHVVRAVGRSAGRSDKLADKMRRRNYPVEKTAGKYHCQRADAIAMFSRHASRIEGI